MLITDDLPNLGLGQGPRTGGVLERQATSRPRASYCYSWTAATIAGRPLPYGV